MTNSETEATMIRTIHEPDESASVLDTLRTEFVERTLERLAALALVFGLAIIIVYIANYILQGVFPDSALAMLPVRKTLLVFAIAASLLVWWTISRRKFTDGQLIGIGVVYVDPLFTFLGLDREANSAQDMSDVLTNLRQLAERTGAAFVLNLHPPKAGASRAILRMLGSISIAGVVRAAYIIDRDPENDDVRIFACSKMSVGPEPPSLAFRLTETHVPALDGGAPLPIVAVEWLGETHVTADELGQGRETTETQAEAERWLKDDLVNATTLETGIPAQTLIKKARAKGISKNALYRAKRKLGVLSKQVEYGGVAYWWLPREREGI